MMRFGIMASAVAAAAISLELTAAPVITINGSSFTFSGVSFGAPAAGRKIVVGIVCYSSTARQFSSVTIGGISASLVIRLDGSNGTANANTAIYEATVPDGTSGDIVVTMSQLSHNCGLAVYRMLNAGAVVSSGSDTTSPYQAVLNIPAGGAAIGVARIASDQTATWSGLTETVDQVVESGVTGMTSAGSTFASAQSGYTVGVTPSSSNTRNRMVAAAWEPV